MAEENQDNTLERLRKGEKVYCDKCGKGYFVPYNTSAEKAHSFDCSNPKCDNHVHWDPVINIE